MVYSALSLGVLVSSTHAQQSTGKTYNPPVHISPGQSNAAQQYSGIVNPNQESQYSIVGSIPEPNRRQQAKPPQHRPQNAQRTPRLQERLAGAFGRRGRTAANRNPAPQNQPRRTPTLADNPTPSQPTLASRPTQSNIASRSNQPIGTGVKPQMVRQPTPTQVRQAPRFQSQNNMSLLESAPSAMASQPTPTANSRLRNTRSAGVQSLAPPSQVVQRRPTPRQYPVQQIESAPALEQSQSNNLTQPIASVGQYYDRPDIRTTSAQQLQDDRFLNSEPDIRVAQTPVDYPSFQDQPSQAAPVSVLNGSEFETPRIAPGYYQDDEEGFGGSSDQENDLRGAEDILAEEEDDDSSSDDDLLDDEPQKSFDKPCDELRTELLNRSITSIALDISPIKSGNASEFGPMYRTWTDQFGRQIATGSISSVRRGYVIIESGGGLQKIPFGNLSDPDLDAVAKYWQTPKECTVSQETFAGRAWMPQTLTWKASNLCHKPLFFENVQLERYGHSHGPFSQPVHSTVHFFKSLALLPYNTGINPPNECRYALGYYRPGNCAPWLEEPFPISLAGAQHQTRAMVGLGFLITP